MVSPLIGEVATQEPEGLTDRLRKKPYVTKVTYGETAYAVGLRYRKYIRAPDSEAEKYPASGKPETGFAAGRSPLVEYRGFEPLTPTLPVLCAPNCANAP